MSLADSFLVDFDADSSEDEEQENDEKSDFVPVVEPEVKELDLDLDMDGSEEKKGDGVSSVTSLLSDTKLATHLQLIQKLMKSTEDEHGLHQGVDREAEYAVIVRSNELAIEIDEEINTLHKYVRDLYATKFSELEQMVQSPLEYAKCVSIIANNTDMTVVEKELGEIVPQAVVLTITVTATSTIGKPLPPEELEKCLEACRAIEQLDEAKREIYSYVESRMMFIAPNLCAITGSEVAARLMGLAGGLAQLSRIPACNVQVLGIKRKTTAGFSTARADLHMGLIATTDLMLMCPPALRNKALRLIAAKCILAARCDSFGEDASGATGRALREEIEGKIQKWQEPPPPKSKRALPTPADKQKKRRGGKKYRKYKEKYKITELQKQKNRMLFGKPEAIDEYTGEGLGLIGQSGAGVLAVKREDTQRLKDKLSKRTKARLAKQQAARPKLAASGLASSIAFTPVQGIELVNPDLQGTQTEITPDKYFSTTGSFMKVGRGSSTPAPGAGAPQMGPGGFAIPLPRPKQ